MAFCQGSRRQRGDHPVLSAQGLVARAGQTLWQHSPLWRGGRDTGAIREIGPAVGLQLDEIAELLRLDDGTLRGGQQHGRAQAQDVREKMADWRAWRLCCLTGVRLPFAAGNVSCPLIASLQGGTSLAGASTA